MLGELVHDLLPHQAIGVELRFVKHELRDCLDPSADGLLHDRTSVAIQGVFVVMLCDRDDDLGQRLLIDLLLHWAVLEAIGDPGLTVGGQDHVADLGEGSKAPGQYAHPLHLHDVEGHGVLCVTEVLGQPECRLAKEIHMAGEPTTDVIKAVECREVRLVEGK